MPALINVQFIAFCNLLIYTIEKETDEISYI